MRETSLDRVIAFCPGSQPPFEGRYKIPWDDPEFSRRMLAEHLAQDHDLASRNAGTIADQTRWMHRVLMKETPGRILDLGCGPGLYLRELTALGHRCHGIDFSPASIEYARRNLAADVELRPEDLREADFGDGFDLVLFIYGEMNVFAPREIRDILARAAQALVPGGRLLLEPQTIESVRSLGQAPAQWSRHTGGLFSDRPYLCLTENHWDEDRVAARQFFHVIEEEGRKVTTYTNTTKGWTDEEVEGLLGDAGFASAAIEEGWTSTNPVLKAWVAIR